MIEVFVYVTGLSLVQIPGGCDPALRIFLPAGGYESSVVDGLHVAKHAVEAHLVPGDGPNLKVTVGDLTLRQSTGDPTQNCASPSSLANLPNLGEIAAGSVRRECLAGPLSTCSTADGKHDALRGRLTFTGKWTVAEMVTCLKQPFLRPPSDQNRTGSFVFVDAAKPWLSFPGGDGPARHFRSGDAVLARALVDDIKPILSALGLPASTPLLDKKLCAQATGLSPVGSSCALVKIVNGPASGEAHVHPPAVGVADGHFAALIDLLGMSGTSSYLPVPTTLGSCFDDGGGVRTAACSPGTVN